MGHQALQATKQMETTKQMEATKQMEVYLEQRSYDAQRHLTKVEKIILAKLLHVYFIFVRVEWYMTVVKYTINMPQVSPLHISPYTHAMPGLYLNSSWLLSL